MRSRSSPALAHMVALAVAACSTAEQDDDRPLGGTGGVSHGDTLGDDDDDDDDDGTSGKEGEEGTGDDVPDPDGPGDDDDDDDDDDADDTGLGPATDPWVPAPGTTWQWQLTGTIDTSADVEVYDIDLFDVDTTVIEQLHEDGRVVICYFSAGSWEDWRPDADQFPDAALGNELDGWPGERWLDHTDPAVRDIMAARLDLAVDKGCDAVEPDNVDGYANDNGVGLTGEEQLDYNGWLADQAHDRGLSIGLKNDLDQLNALAGKFDWALNEQCVQYQECETLVTHFIDQGKAVFHVEYVDVLEDGPALHDEVCVAANGWGFSTLVKQWDLGAWGMACWR